MVRIGAPDCAANRFDACSRHGVASGMHFRDLTMMKEWMSRGMRFVAYKTDFRLLQDASGLALKALRG